MPQLASDNFDRVDANTLGANWTTINVDQGNQIGITSNRAKTKNLASGDALSSYSAITWPNDQYAEVKVTLGTSDGSGTGHGPAVRIDTTGASTYYRAVVNSFGGGQVEVSKFINAAYTLIADISTAWAADDLLRLEVQGNTLRVYRNGVQIGTNYTDASIASGRAGIAYSSTADTSNDANDWAGGSLTANTAPTAPQSLTATPGSNQVALAWSVPASNGGSAITGYKIYRSLSTNTETLLASPAGTGTAYTDSTAVNGTTYYYKVSAVNAIGESVLSSEANATPAAAPTAPTAPLGLVATPGNAQVFLSWSPPASNGGSAVTAYRIYRSLTTGTETLYASPAGTGTTYTDAAVSNGTTYFYKVLAVNAVGSSALSTESSATPAVPPPATSTRTLKRLYGPTLLSNAAATLYTVPASTTTVIRHIHVSNPTGAPVNFTLSIGASAAGTRIWDAQPIPAGDILDHYQDFALQAAEIIQGFAGTNLVLNLTIDGYELGIAAAPPAPIFPSDTLFPSDISP